MANDSTPTYKKFYRDADSHLNGQIPARHGKQEHQKIKPYVVLQYLLKNTDDNHTASAYDIIGFLEEHGLTAERRSIYRDIEEINTIQIMLEDDCDIEEAAEILAEDEDRKLIHYDASRKGFYAKRPLDINDVRLLAECVYSAKFIAEGQAQLLVDTVCSLASDHQAEQIRHNALLTDRVKTNNRQVLDNIAYINEAMSTEYEGRPHTPEKISFKYLQYTIDDMTKQVERRHGEDYIVSPYKLLINDGNYYLLAFEDKKNSLRTFRVDRMRSVCPLGEPRQGESVFAEIDLKTYTQRVFSMYSGKPRRVTIRFINLLLDTAVERFGMHDVIYAKVDHRHFTVTATVEISDQFFGWLLGFGRRVKLISPDDVVEQFGAYLDKVREMYQS